MDCVTAGVKVVMFPKHTEGCAAHFEASHSALLALFGSRQVIIEGRPTSISALLGLYMDFRFFYGLYCSVNIKIIEPFSYRGTLLCL